MKKIQEMGSSGLSKKIFVLAVISWITLMASLDGHCAVINVPADQPTLQATLAAAIDGDQILPAEVSIINVLKKKQSSGTSILLKI